MSDLHLQILKLVDDNNGVIENTLKSPELSKIDVSTLQANLTSLWAKEMIVFSKIETDKWVLTKEAEQYLKAGATPEVQVVDEVLKALEGLTISQLKEKLGPMGAVGQGKAFKNKWLSKDGDKLIAQVEKLPEDVVLNELKTISETGTLNDKKELTELKKKIGHFDQNRWLQN